MAVDTENALLTAIRNHIRTTLSYENHKCGIRLDGTGAGLPGSLLVMHRSLFAIVAIDRIKWRGEQSVLRDGHCDVMRDE